MQVSALSVIKKDVMSVHNGARLGMVQSIIIQPSSKRILFFCLDTGKEGLRYLLSSDVRETNQQMIIVNSETVLSEEDDLVRYQEILASPPYLIGSRVVTQSGKKLGNCLDYCFDVTTYEVTRLVISSKLLQKILTAHHHINAVDIISITPKEIVVRDATITSTNKAKSALPVQSG